MGGWVSRCDLLIREGQSPTAEHRALYSVNRNGKEGKKEVGIGITESLCCTAETDATL